MGGGRVSGLVERERGTAEVSKREKTPSGVIEEDRQQRTGGGRLGLSDARERKEGEQREGEAGHVEWKSRHGGCDEEAHAFPC